MATTSTYDELFTQIDGMIATHVAAIEEHNAQIEALKIARKALQDTTPAPAAPKSNRRARRNKSTEDEPIKMVTEKQLLWLERKGYDGDNPEDLTREEASAILDELFNGSPEADEPEVEVEETPRAKRTAKASRTRTKRTNVKNGNGNGNKKDSEPQTRKDAILALHSEGLKPREIADELEANVSYVYLILRQQREAAKK